MMWWLRIDILRGVVSHFKNSKQTFVGSLEVSVDNVDVVDVAGVDVPSLLKVQGEKSS